MFVATGGAKYLDVFERVLFNAYAVGLSADGKAFFYDNPLQRRPDHEQRSGAEAGGEPLRRGWFTCPCCPPNIVRWTAQLGDHLAAERQGTLYIAQYAESRIETDALAVNIETAYPWDGDVRLTIARAPGHPYAIRLRIPAWARDCTLDGVPVAAENGWLTVERNWAEGDSVQLRLPMPVRGHASHPYLDATRGAVAIGRGPLVYCVEQQDSPAPVDDLVLSPGHIAAADISSSTVEPGKEPAVESEDLVEDVPGAVVLRLTADVKPPQSPELYLEFTTARPTAEAAATVSVALVPYFLWGNRRPGAMRVWIRAQ
jgi:DUF1680 family protein